MKYFQQLYRPRALARDLLVGAAATAVLLMGSPTMAQQADRQIVLPGATSAEGITAGPGSTFYAGDLFRGDIYRGDLEKGTAERFIDVPDGRLASGLKFDQRTGLLFVAGATTGQAYVYDTKTGATVRTYQLAEPGTLINDVTITEQGAWFTNSFAPQLFFVPIGPTGVVGDATTLNVSGPAAAIMSGAGVPNLNGIAATPDGGTLLVSHSGAEKIFIIDPKTGASADLGIELPGADGILLEAGRLYAIQLSANQIAVFDLSADLKSAKRQKTITSPLLHEPTTIAPFGNRLAAVNAHFSTGIPPRAPAYEVVIMSR